MGEVTKRSHQRGSDGHDGNCRFPQDAFGDGAEEKTAEAAPAVRAQHDKVGVGFAREFEDSVDRSGVNDHPRRIAMRALCGDKPCSKARSASCLDNWNC